MRQQRGVRIVNAAMNRHRPAQADFLGNFRKHIAERIEGRAKRRKFLANVQPVNEGREGGFLRQP